MMSTTSEATIRELDHRTGDGIEVALLWDSETGQVFVTVSDEQLQDAFAFEVPGADALDAFYHPYVYLQGDRDNQPLAA